MILESPLTINETCQHSPQFVTLLLIRRIDQARMLHPQAQKLLYLVVKQCVLKYICITLIYLEDDNLSLLTMYCHLVESKF